MTVARSVRRVNAGIVSTCVVGLFLSYYAYIVETSKEEDHSYEPMCDISEHVSCSKAFMSEYGKGFGIIPKNSILYVPNSVYGLGFYTSIAAISVLNTYFSTVTLVFLTILSNFGSVYLAYILYMLEDICVVCLSTYIVNAVNLVFALRKLRSFSQGSSKKRKTN